MYRTFIKRFSVFALSFILFCTSAGAQRQSPGRGSLEGYVNFGPVIPGAFQRALGLAGGGLQWSWHDYSGHFFAGGDFSAGPLRLVESEVTDGDGVVLIPEEVHDHNFYEITAFGGYMVRVWAPRSRVVIFSAGADLGIGIRHCQELGGYVKEYGSGGGNTYYLKTGFLLNASPVVTVEVFPFRNLSMDVTFRPKATIFCGLAGEADWFRPMGSFGIKYYL